MRMLFGRMSKQVKVVMGQSYATPDALKTRSVSYGSRFSVQVFLLEPQRKSSSGLHLGSVSFCSCVSMRVCVSIQSSHFNIKKLLKTEQFPLCPVSDVKMLCHGLRRPFLSRGWE